MSVLSFKHLHKVVEGQRGRGWSAWTAERKNDESYCHSYAYKIRLSFDASFL